jgi:hypothetical protein
MVPDPLNFSIDGHHFPNPGNSSSTLSRQLSRIDDNPRVTDTSTGSSRQHRHKVRHSKGAVLVAAPTADESTKRGSSDENQRDVSNFVSSDVWERSPSPSSSVEAGFVSFYFNMSDGRAEMWSCSYSDVSRGKTSDVVAKVQLSTMATNTQFNFFLAIDEGIFRFLH